MNFRYISFIALISVSPVLAMDYLGQDPMDPKSKAAARLHAVEQHAAARRLLAQNVKHKAEQRAEAEKERDKEVVSTLGDAFGQLPNNKSHSEKEKQDFYAMIEQRMPKAVQRYIGEFQGKSNAEFINAHLVELIPSVVKKHAFYPSMPTLMNKAIVRLNDHAAVHKQRVQARVEEDRKQPYIIAVAGFWSFNDEPSKFRWRAEVRNFESDVAQWFRLTYPNNPVKPLASNEWLAVLYSDGSIQWQISALNKARLKRLTKEQLLLAVALWNQPDFLKDNQLMPYRTLPEYISSAMQSNYEIASSRVARKIRKGLQYTAMAGAALSSLYWSYSWLEKAASPGYHYVMRLDKNGNYVSMNRVGLSIELDVLRVCGIMAIAGCASLAGIWYSGKEHNKNGRDIFELRNIDNFGSNNLTAAAVSFSPIWALMTTWLVADNSKFQLIRYETV